MRKMKNQEQFVNESKDEKNFIILPFNKENKNDSNLKERNMNLSFSKKRFDGTHNKENINSCNFKKNNKQEEKKQTNKPNKIFMNDIFDFGYVTEIISNQNFLSDSIIKKSLSNR